MFRKIRTGIFWLHLAVGVTAGLFILNMAVSGICIAYAKQIIALAESSQRTVAVPANAKPLDPEALIVKVQVARPDAKLSGLTRYANPAASAMFYVGRDNNVLYANPYTGDVLGEGSKSVRAFFQFMTSWHRWLALEGTARPVGKAITGIVVTVYFGMLMSGLFLWLPREWSRLRVRQRALLDFKLKGGASNWNWHNTVGLWCAPLLLLATLTGIVMSYDWANNLLFTMTGNPVPERRAEGGRAGGRDANGPAKIDVADTNALWTKAGQQVTNWDSISLRFASSSNPPATFFINTAEQGRPDTVAQLALDRDTGDVVRWQPYAAQNAGQKLRSWVRPIHTGEGAGLLGQSLAVVSALGTIILVWTGFSLAVRRFRGRREFLSTPLSETEVITSPIL